MALWLIRKMISKTVIAPYAPHTELISVHSSIYLCSMNPQLTDEEAEASKLSATRQVGHWTRNQTWVCLVLNPGLFITWKGLSVTLGDSHGVLFSVKSIVLLPRHFWKQQFRELKLQFFILGGWHLRWGIRLEHVTLPPVTVVEALTAGKAVSEAAS